MQKPNPQQKGGATVCLLGKIRASTLNHCVNVGGNSHGCAAADPC